jgi:hypothetical protein
MKARRVYWMILVSVLVMLGCAPSEDMVKVESRDSLPPNCQPDIFHSTDRLDGKYETLALVEFDDAGMSVGCGKEEIREKLRAEACKAGANGILIVEEHNPSLVSTCYRVTAELISH